MGKCIYCGKWAGFFKNKHEECHENFVKKKQENEKIEKAAKIKLLNTMENHHFQFLSHLKMRKY